MYLTIYILYQTKESVYEAYTVCIGSYVLSEHIVHKYILLFLNRDKCLEYLTLHRLSTQYLWGLVLIINASKRLKERNPTFEYLTFHFILTLSF